MSGNTFARLPLGNLESYQVSPTNGFLPSEPPLARLPEQYKEWEDIASNLSVRIQDKSLQQAISQLPAVSTEWLYLESEWRRAYVILGFLADGLLHGSGKTVDKLPANISLPLTAISIHLGLPPCSTLAGQNLWNYNILDAEKPVSDPSNLEAQFTFNGVDDESWFFVVVVAIEARGAPIIPLLLQAFEAAAADDSEAVTDLLQQAATHIQGLGEMLPRMYERCDPHFFYNRIRPFLTGTKASATLPRGVFYEDGEGGGTYHQLGGSSAVQSSLLHFIDIALGIDHYPTGTGPNLPTQLGESKSPEKRATLLEEMRQHMPGRHRLFLQHVASIANIRDYITAHHQDNYLQTAYNACLEALIAFRNKHLQIISRYIILPSRQVQREPTTASVSEGGGSKQPPTPVAKTQGPQGTGGSDPVKFLKQVRDETKTSIVTPKAV